MGWKALENSIALLTGLSVKLSILTEHSANTLATSLAKLAVLQTKLFSEGHYNEPEDLLDDLKKDNYKEPKSVTSEDRARIPACQNVAKCQLRLLNLEEERQLLLMSCHEAATSGDAEPLVMMEYSDILNSYFNSNTPAPEALAQASALRDNKREMERFKAVLTEILHDWSIPV
jgi:hypothetical protein